MLVDSSVWIDHLRRPRSALVSLLERDLVLTHPFVIGELACGALRERDRFLDHLKRLPSAPVARDGEVMQLVDSVPLWGRGLGWVDAHLLASSRLAGTSLWTLDRALAEAAAALGVGGDA